jgi:hypothetical protein
MKINELIRWVALLSVAFTTQLHAQSSAFTYQGSLTDSGSPASGIYDLRFSIYDVETNGVAISVLTNAATTIADGLFTVTLDFGASVFDGNSRWLEIGAATNEGGAFTSLSPRQRITSTPYAIRAASSSAVESGSVTDPSFIGTTGFNPLELSINSTAVFRIQYAASPGGMQPNIVAGGSDNWIDSFVRGSVIAGGGGPGASNSITGTANTTFSVIGGGVDNHIAHSSSATINGGYGNRVASGADYSTIAGGFENDIGEDAAFSLIAGGRENNISSNASYTLAAGRRAKANHPGAFVWADSTDADFNSTGNDQFLIRASGGVGVNKNNPATALDVAGQVTAQAFKFPTPKTFVQQLTASSFVPDNPNEGYNRGSGLISPAGDTTLQFHASVNLPDGATVTKLIGVFMDIGTAEDFTDIDLRLQYFTTNNLSIVTMADINSTNTVGISSGRVEVGDSTIANAVIDNYSRAYLLFLQFTVNTATSNTRFYGVRIEYTLQTLAP